MATANSGLQGGLPSDFPVTENISVPNNLWTIEALKILMEQGGRISGRNHELIERYAE